MTDDDISECIDGLLEVTSDGTAAFHAAAGDVRSEEARALLLDRARRFGRAASALRALTIAHAARRPPTRGGRSRAADRAGRRGGHPGRVRTAGSRGDRRLPGCARAEAARFGARGGDARVRTAPRQPGDAAHRPRSRRAPTPRGRRAARCETARTCSAYRSEAVPRRMDLTEILLWLIRLPPTTGAGRRPTRAEPRTRRDPVRARPRDRPGRRQRGPRGARRAGRGCSSVAGARSSRRRAAAAGRPRGGARRDGGRLPGRIPRAPRRRPLDRGARPRAHRSG